MIRQCLIPVAGLGTRLLPISHVVAKELLPIGPKPTLQWIAEELAQAGIEHLCLVTSPRKTQIQQLFLGDPELESALELSGKRQLLDSLWSHGRYASVRISTAIQEKQLGLGHAVLCGFDQLAPGPFVLALGDCVMGPPGESQLTQRLINVFVREKADAVIAFESVSADAVGRYGIADPATTGDEFRLRDIVEKPDPATAPSNLAVAARYVLSDAIFPLLRRQQPGLGGEIQLTDAIRAMIQNGGRVFGVRLQSTESRIDVGNYESFARAFVEFALTNNPQIQSMAREILKAIS